MTWLKQDGKPPESAHTCGRLAIKLQGNNRVLKKRPPPIPDEEQRLNRRQRCTLSQLRSGHCHLLQDYKHRVFGEPSDICTDCGASPQDVRHLFACTTHPTTPACTWWNRPEEDPSSGKLESTHPSRTSVKYDQVFFLGVESIMRVNAASLDIRDATTSTPGTLNDLTTDLIIANNNNNNNPTDLSPEDLWRNPVRSIRAFSYLDNGNLD